LKSVLTGPAFRETDTAALRELVNEKLLRRGAPLIGCSILFSQAPLRGWFRYGDRFQLLPVPSVAPTQEFSWGNNPLTVEVKFERSSDAGVIGRRHDRSLREVERLLSVFTAIPLKRLMVQSHWVRDPRDADGAVLLAQEGYQWPGRQALLDDFSDVSGIPPAPLVPTGEYYGHLGIDSLKLPSDLSAAFDAYYRLEEGQRKRFLCAAYWVNHAISSSSTSASHVALVQAIEAVMLPQSNEVCAACGKPKGDGPTAAFQKFVDEYSRGVPEKERKNFYNVRSALTHGRWLHHWDDIDGFNFSPISTAEQINLRWLFSIARIVLVNWLWRQAGT
jgi:hypothetical protein